MRTDSLRGRSTARPAIGAAVVAATYIYFLIFAEYSFLALAQPHLGTSRDVQQLMTALGLAGIVGSFLAAAFAKKYSWALKLSGGLIACAATGLIALTVDRKIAFVFGAVSIGLALGWTTVTLATNLRATLGRRLGAWIGA